MMKNVSFFVFSIIFVGSCVASFILNEPKMDFNINTIFDYGPYTPAEVSYEYPILNDTELTPFSDNLTTQIRGQLFFPNTSISHSEASFPILVFLPGKHADCRLPTPEGYPALDFGSADSLGHCSDDLPTVQSHIGFSYLGQYFASHGYIVASIDVLLINNKWGISGDSTLNFVRARLVLRTLQKMIEWNNNSETSKQILNGIDLSNKFDFTQVGMMGHSRGGEGVRNAYNMLMENKGPSDASQWRERLPNVMIKAVMEIAPMYYGQNGTKLGVDSIPWAMIVSGCEDDETDYAHVYLASDQLKTSTQANHVIHVYGANHEYFNTEWQIGLQMCFGDQDPLWDVNATTFNVSDIYPPARNTSMDITLLKVNGSQSQRRVGVYALGLFFRAYVGANADLSLAEYLKPNTPFPANLTEIGRQYFDNSSSIRLGFLIGNKNNSVDTQIMVLDDYAQSIFNAFTIAYDNSPVPPPHFSHQPPKKGSLSLGCLDKIENAVHIDFTNATIPEVVIIFLDVETKIFQYIHIQLSRRSSCWFESTHPSACAEPREMLVDIQLITKDGYIPVTTVSMKSRYNLQFARCDAMDYPPEKIGFLPVMFETVRIPVVVDTYVFGLRLISENGGSIILGDVSAVFWQFSTASTFSMSSNVFFSIFLIFFRL